MKKVQTGLDMMHYHNFAPWHGKRLGVVCHQASIDGEGRHILELLHPLHKAGTLTIQAVFGPQHGLWGHTQDNMIEWEGSTDPELNVPVYSLYGEHRKPPAEFLDGVEVLVIDLQDVGARYYTFIWTLAHCLEQCAELGIPVVVLDRPNPIGGTQVEGPGHDMEFKSFVGLYSMPVRHGKTIGEIAKELARLWIPDTNLTVIEMEGWERSMYFEHTGLLWALPSPNMPSPSTAIVYPGMCLFEGTKLSEGRGTTKPFEMWGAPFIQGRELCRQLNALALPGVIFRAVSFQPTFQKHAGEMCEGGFIHVTHRREYESTFTGIAILHTIRRLYGDALQWQDPPYEYEYIKLPIDILTGGTWVRVAIDSQMPLSEIRAKLHVS